MRINGWPDTRPSIKAPVTTEDAAAKASELADGRRETRQNGAMPTSGKAFAMTDHELNALRSEVAAVMQASDPSHDMSHLDRVARQCRLLGQLEGANERILLAAAYLHDLVNIPKNHPDRQQASQASANAAAAILARLGFAQGEVDQVCRAIEEHSYSRGLPCSSVESRVLQDADRLDALGAIGILRTATCGAFMGSGYYDVADPFARARTLDDQRYMLDHFPLKLLRLEHRFQTDAGRREAERRTAFMRSFIAQLTIELGEAEGGMQDWPSLR